MILYFYLALNFGNSITNLNANMSNMNAIITIEFYRVNYHTLSLCSFKFFVQNKEIGSCQTNKSQHR